MNRSCKEKERKELTILFCIQIYIYKNISIMFSWIVINYHGKSLPKFGPLRVRNLIYGRCL